MMWILSLFSFFADGSLLIQSLIGASAVLILVTIGVTLLRNQSAALRHRVLTLAMVAILAIPAFMMLLPHLGPRWLSKWSDVNYGSIASTTSVRSVLLVDDASKNSAIGNDNSHASIHPNAIHSSNRD